MSSRTNLTLQRRTRLTKLLGELRELASKGQAGDASITADTIREKISETQNASLGLFQKVYEKRAAENSSSSSTESSETKEEKKEEKKD
jgi:molecular chaperone DnaK